MHLRSPDALPFVEPARRHEAAPLAKGVAKRRPLGDRLAARIGKLAADRGILGPMRNEAPAVVARHALAVASDAHDDDFAAGADVVARLEVRRVLERELQRDDFRIGMERVPAAHAAEVTMRAG